MENKQPVEVTVKYLDGGSQRVGWTGSEFDLTPESARDEVLQNLIETKPKVDAEEEGQISSGKLLGLLLESRHISKVEFAAKLGVSHSYIHHLISGRKEIKLARLEDITEMLRLSEGEYHLMLEALAKEDAGLNSLLTRIWKREED